MDNVQLTMQNEQPHGEIKLEYDLLNSLLESCDKKLNEVLESYLRSNAKPLIKGDITKGKLKWRGIVLCRQNHGFGKPSETWLEQRGIELSPKIQMPFFEFL